MCIVRSLAFSICSRPYVFRSLPSDNGCAFPKALFPKAFAANGPPALGDGGLAALIFHSQRSWLGGTCHVCVLLGAILVSTFLGGTAVFLSTSVLLALWAASMGGTGIGMEKHFSTHVIVLSLYLPRCAPCAMCCLCDVDFDQLTACLNMVQCYGNVTGSSISQTRPNHLSSVVIPLTHLARTAL